MVNLKRIRLVFVIAGLLLVLSSCYRSQSDYMTEQQREQLEDAYDSLQTTYKSLMAEYKTDSDTLPGELRSLYTQMQKMHRQMDTNHRQMMRMNMDRHMQGEKMMADGMGMHMQNNMAGEWYQQMMSMHDRMANMHQNMGQQSMAEINRRLSKEYEKMRQMIPSADEPSEVPFNEEGDPSLLNGESLYAQNCASCHGNSAEGIGITFPPLVDSEWITGDKSVPIRILLHGLSGEIEVNGESYRGSMPSFKARLSAAEIASILNFLRTESKGNQSEISQENVIEVARKYNQQTSTWSAEELNINEQSNQ